MLLFSYQNCDAYCGRLNFLYTKTCFNALISFTLDIPPMYNLSHIQDIINIIQSKLLSVTTH